MSSSQQVFSDLRFRLSASSFKSPIGLSLTIHLSVVTLFLAISFWPKPEVKWTEFDVIDAPRAAPQMLRTQPIEPKKASAPVEKKRAVFGASRNAVTDEQGIAVKQGNTVVKAPDEEKLREDDVDSIPIPVDEYLVSEMPRLLEEIRIPYPPEAKKKGLQGPVVMDLLIDPAGQVRDVKLVSGLGLGLSDAALEAAKKMRFAPARVQDKPVAVRIRYAYRFVLEK